MWVNRKWQNFFHHNQVDNFSCRGNFALKGQSSLLFSLFFRLLREIEAFFSSTFCQRHESWSSSFTHETPIFFLSAEEILFSIQYLGNSRK